MWLMKFKESQQFQSLPLMLLIVILMNFNPLIKLLLLTVVGRNTFLLSPHLCFIIVFICDLFVSRDDPLMS